MHLDHGYQLPAQSILLRPDHEIPLQSIANSKNCLAARAQYGPRPYRAIPLQPSGFKNRIDGFGAC